MAAVWMPRRERLGPTSTASVRMKTSTAASGGLGSSARAFALHGRMLRALDCLHTARKTRLEHLVKPISIRVVQALVAVLALVFTAAGLWAMIDPRSFYLNAAPFPPYNVHLLHDIGAFQIGLGACLAAGLRLGDALLVVLVGNTFGAVAHFIAHVVDRDEGGHVSDPFIFGFVALLLIALTVARATTSSSPPGATP